MPYLPIIEVSNYAYNLNILPRPYPIGQNVKYIQIGIPFRFEDFGEYPVNMVYYGKGKFIYLKSSLETISGGTIKNAQVRSYADAGDFYGGTGEESGEDFANWTFYVHEEELWVRHSSLTSTYENKVLSAGEFELINSIPESISARIVPDVEYIYSSTIPVQLVSTIDGNDSLVPAFQCRWTCRDSDRNQLEFRPYSPDDKTVTLILSDDAKFPVTVYCTYLLTGIVYSVSYKNGKATADPYTPPQGGGGGAGAGGGAGLPSGTGGGGGSFPSDPGPSLVDRIPNGQTGNDIAQSGLFTMYLMNQQYMNLMGEILWEDNVAIQAIKEIFGNPIDSVISTISYPFNLLNLVQYGAQNLYIGPWNTGLPFQALTNSSFQIDWGSISIPFAWGNFLDYSPHTKMELFLPWGPGYVTIDPNDVSPFSNTAGNFNVPTFTAGSIQVKTNVELGKGTCVHNVIGNNGRVIGSYSGIVGKQVPITALDTGGKALTTIAAVSSIVGGVVAGSLAAKGAMDSGRLTGSPMKDPMRPFESASYWDTGMISGRASAQNLINTGHNLASRAINSTPITFPRAGTFSDGSSAMTVQTPFLIISRPVQSVPTQYGHYNGYPSNIHYTNFSNLFGYTEISEIHLDNVTATADELQELDTILKGGILL